MRWFLRALVVASLAAGCDEGDTGNFETGTATTSSKPKSNGFSADLAKTMGSDGKVASNDKADAKPDTKADAKPDDKADAKPDDKADAKPDTKADAKPDTKADAKPDTKADAKPDTKADAKPDTKADAKPDTKADAKPDTKADAKPDTKADAKPDTKADAKPDTKVPVASPGAVKPPINLSAPRVLVKPSAELAAIKLSLSPNWDRDYGEAGTISLVVKVPGKEDTRVFSFRYGYEDAKAPTDRDAYKKWLTENKIFTPKMDRQRGSAWYLEGEDASGPAFRILVNYGGKKLICGGSLYRDAQSSQLGDIRDKTIIQAKEICETLQL